MNPDWDKVDVRSQLAPTYSDGLQLDVRVSVVQLPDDGAHGILGVGRGPVTQVHNQPPVLRGVFLVRNPI